MARSDETSSEHSGPFLSRLEHILDGPMPAGRPHAQVDSNDGLAEGDELTYAIVQQADGNRDPIAGGVDRVPPPFHRRCSVRPGSRDFPRT